MFGLSTKLTWQVSLSAGDRRGGSVMIRIKCWFRLHPAHRGRGQIEKCPWSRERCSLLLQDMSHSQIIADYSLWAPRRRIPALSEGLVLSFCLVAPLAALLHMKDGRDVQLRRVPAIISSFRFQKLRGYLRARKCWGMPAVAGEGISHICFQCSTVHWVLSPRLNSCSEADTCRLSSISLLTC